MLRLLIIEDSDDEARSVLRTMSLRWPDLEHRRVAGREDLVSALEQPWDVIVSDYELASFSGVEALEAITDAGLDIPFFIVSDALSDEAAVQVMRAGAHDCLRRDSLALLVPAVERELRDAAVRRQHRIAREALQQSGERFRQIVETAHEGVWLLDAAADTIYMNRRMARMLSVAPEDTVGASVYDFIDEEGRRLIETSLRRRRRSSSELQEFRLRRADGSELWTYLSTSPMTDEDGRDSGTVAFVMDITEQKRMQEQLMISDRMASVGILAAGVAHEINNPLAAVIANLTLLAERLDGASSPTGATANAVQHRALDHAEIQGCLRDAREAADQVRQTVQDLKVFSRSDDERRVAVDVREVIESALRIAWNEIKHRARLVQDLQPVAPVLADPHQLVQVFLNLIINAAQAIPEGDARANEIRIGTRTLADHRVLVTVQDTGEGMSPEVKARIFTPFFTTKPVGTGTGLGLPICHRIVTHLDGEIVVDSTPGVGTELRVFLPAARTHSEKSRPEEESVEETTRHGSLLVVDDEATIGLVIRRALQEQHEVEVDSRASDALARIASGARFDLILCDLMMPEMTGMDLHSEITRIAPDQAQRMIFLTGGAFTPGALTFLEQIPNPHLEKPFDLSSLRALVSRCLEGR